MILVKPTHFILLVFTSIFILKAEHAAAQEYFEPLKLTHLHGLGQNFNGSTDKATFYETSLDLTVPIQSKKLTDRGIVLLTGLSAEQTVITPRPSEDDLQLYSFLLKVGMVKEFNSKWKGTFVLLPKIHSDFKQVSSKAYQLGGLALFKYSLSKDFNLRFGAYANSELFGPFFVPIFGIYLKKDKFEMSGNLPLKADLNYSFTKMFKLGASYTGFNKSFQIQDNGVERYLEKATNEIGAYSRLSFGIVQLELFAGTSFLRTFKVFDMNDRTTAAFPLYKLGNDRTQLNPNIDNGLLVKGSLIIRIPTETNPK
jgi:hypothetical protein